MSGYLTEPDTHGGKFVGTVRCWHSTATEVGHYQPGNQASSSCLVAHSNEESHSIPSRLGA